MRLLEGLSTTRIRRIVWTRGDSAEVIHAHTSNALAWNPEISHSYEMWAAHTEVIYRQWFAECSTAAKAEELTREKELA